MRKLHALPRSCPTEAFAGPYQLDARRCISYGTIEHRGVLAEENASELNGWVFGCDVCQDVCPWNRKAKAGHETVFDERPEWTNPDLIAWLTRDESEWRAILKGTALRRAKRSGLVRNAALVLGTRRLKEAVAPLSARLDDQDEDPTVLSRWQPGPSVRSEPSRPRKLDRHQADPAPLVQALSARALASIDRIRQP